MSPIPPPVKRTAPRARTCYRALLIVLSEDDQRLWLSRLTPVRYFLGLRLTPWRAATEASAITLPPAGLPFLRSLLATLRSLIVGGLIVSFLAIVVP